MLCGVNCPLNEFVTTAITIAAGMPEVNVTLGNIHREQPRQPLSGPHLGGHLENHLAQSRPQRLCNARRGGTARRLRHSTGESTSRLSDGGRQRLPALHGLRRRRIRRQVVQPARPRGPRPARRRSSASRRSTSSPTPTPTTRRTSTSWSTSGCNLIVTVGFNLAAATTEPRPRRTPTSSSRSSTTLVERATSTASPTARTSSRSSSTPRRPRSSAATPRRATARPASSAPSVACRFPPVTIFMDGFVDGVDVLQHARRARTSRSSAGTCKTQNGSFTGGFDAGTRPLERRQSADRPERRRASCRSAARSTRAPPRPSRTPARTSRSSASTPTCSRPTRSTPTCSSPRS